jgi:hypothetical protein
LRQRIGHRHGFVVRASSDGELYADTFSDHSNQRIDCVPNAPYASLA